LIPQFASGEEYYRVVKPRRIEYLKALLRQSGPKVVVCYGKAFWSDYRQLFKGSTFEQEGQFHTGVFHNMLVILTGHFAVRSMNLRFDELVTNIKGNAKGI